MALARHQLQLHSLLQNSFNKQNLLYRGGILTQTGSGKEFCCYSHFFRLTAVFIKSCSVLSGFFSTSSPPSKRNSKN